MKGIAVDIFISAEEIDNATRTQVKRGMERIIESNKISHVRELLYQMIHDKRGATPVVDATQVTVKKRRREHGKRREDLDENDDDISSKGKASKQYMPTQIGNNRRLLKDNNGERTLVSLDDKTIDNIFQPAIPLKHAASQLTLKNSTLKVNVNASKGLVYIFKEKQLWIAAGIGSAVTLVLVVICVVIRAIFLKCRGKKSGPLDMNFNCLSDSSKDPIYVKLSQLHSQRNGNHYVVSVLDESNNFSIGTSSSSSSEEEIFNASDLLEDRHTDSVTRVNLTSTPIKETRPSRLSRSLPTTPVRRKLSGFYMSPPISPLAMEPPVFASPIKMNNYSWR